MKQCPQCKRTYDDSQSFCLMDGTPLTVESEQATLVIPQYPAAKKSRLLLWAALTGLVILIFGIPIGGFLVYTLSRTNNDTTADKRQSKTSVSPITKPSPSPKTASPSTSPTDSPSEESSPKTAASPTNSTADDAEDITPISWNTSAIAFKSEVGLTYKFRCPENGEEHSIWGSDVYTQDSSICTAAVHAGLFSLEAGGIVTIEFRAGRLTYGSTTRNDIKSNPFGEYEHSFVVR